MEEGPRGCHERYRSWTGYIKSGIHQHVCQPCERCLFNRNISMGDYCQTHTGQIVSSRAVHDFIRQYCIRHRIEILPLAEVTDLQLSRLPDYHKDPFGRILICQAFATSTLQVLFPRRNPLHTATSFILHTI